MDRFFIGRPAGISYATTFPTLGTPYQKTAALVIKFSEELCCRSWSGSGTGLGLLAFVFPNSHLGAVYNLAFAPLPLCSHFLIHRTNRRLCRISVASFPPCHLFAPVMPTISKHIISSWVQFFLWDWNFDV
jgi:hypothetical protein